jgi:hypothetical protein
LADTAFPAANYSNVVMMDEIVPKDSHGIPYMPTATQPGYVDGLVTTYNVKGGIPDSTPEGAR